MEPVRRREVLQSAAHLTAASFAAAAMVTLALGQLNARVPALELLAVQVDLWMVFLLILLPPTLAWAVAASAARRFAPTDVSAVGAVSLFALLWFARLEPAHQMISVRPHVSGWGIAELATIVTLAGLLLACWFRTSGSSCRRAGALTALLLPACAVMSVLAWCIEPSRRRDDAIARVSAMLPETTASIARTSRVLVVGIDGLEWRTAAWMLEHGRMPTLRGLLASGRYYQLDNRGLASSAEIWTAIYTGQPQSANDVGGFAKWRFAGVSKPIAFLPRFGMHGWFFLDEVLRRVELPLWHDEPVSTEDMLAAPLWTIASAGRTRVGVFDPTPYASRPEDVNGFFAIDDDDQLQIVRRDPEGVQTIDRRAVPVPAKDDEFGERSRSVEAARLFAADRVDLGIYYTHFLDTAQHRFWDYRLRGAVFGGDPHPLDEAFDHTAIRRAYDAADAALAAVIAGFGQPATVIVVSDHGWRYDDYEHFKSPFGVAIVSPAERTGYAGVADALAVAPTALSMLGIPADLTMAPPMAPYREAHARVTYAAAIRQAFLPRLVQDDGRLRLLRSLGYVEGRRTSPRPGF